MMKLNLRTTFVMTLSAVNRLLTVADIRIQQRNGRKTLTTVQGVPREFDQKRILKALKKDFACNGTLVKDSEMGEVIQLQGDQRLKVSEFLTTQLPIQKKSIKIHGYEPRHTSQADPFQVLSGKYKGPSVSVSSSQICALAHAHGLFTSRGAVSSFSDSLATTGCAVYYAII